MDGNTTFYLRMLSICAWAISGIAVIINFIESDYPGMFLFMILMFLNATMYTVHKKYLG